MAGREFYVFIEKDEDGFFVGEVPQLTACYSQGRTLDELMDNMRDIICLCLEDADTHGDDFSEFVGIQKIVV
jgi:predicted RNase H-like HicB family nuclease